jgi:hypothetical protein
VGYVRSESDGADKSRAKSFEFELENWSEFKIVGMEVKWQCNITVSGAFGDGSRRGRILL